MLRPLGPRLLSILFLLPLLTVPCSAGLTPEAVREVYGALPLSFEPDQAGFVARGRGYALSLTPSEAVLHLAKPGGERRSSSIIRLRLVGAQPSAALRGAEELPGRNHYLLGNDPRRWRTDVPTYARVEALAVYPGIDLVYYGNQGRLELDFVVAPGADPGTVRFAYEGVEGIEIAVGGDLVLRVGGGEVRLRRPEIYQEVEGRRRQVAGGYVLRGDGQVGFRLDGYDAARPVVIDPVLTYSTYLGGNSVEESRGIAVDGAGNAYLTGYTWSTNFPAVNAAQGTLGNDPFTNGDAFITKLNAAGTAVVFSTYLGGDGNDEAYDIAVNVFGEPYVTGYTTSTDFPVANRMTNPAPPFQTQLAGGSDVFVTKLRKEGNVLAYSTYLGGTGPEEGRAIALSADYAYVTGFTSSTDFPVLNALYPGFRGGAYDAFVTLIHWSGASLTYSTYLGGSGRDMGNAIAVGFGGAYVTGYTLSNDFPVAGSAPFQTTCGCYDAGGIADAFVAKIFQGTILEFSTFLGGGFFDYGEGIAVDSVGNVYVAGTTGSNNFPTRNPIQAALAGASDVFVAKLNPAATGLVYSTYLGGGGYDFASGLALDSSANAYVTGYTASTGFPTLPLQTKAGTDQDAFVTKLDAAGSRYVYSRLLGGSADDLAWDVAVDGSGSAYVTGYSLSSDFPLQPPQSTAGLDSRNGFVAKIGAGTETPAGADVVVEPLDSATGTRPVTLTFAAVTQSGTTGLATRSNGPPPPAGLQLGSPPTFYELETTAVFTPPVEVCIRYAGTSFAGSEEDLRLFHFEPTAGEPEGEWVDHTVLPVDTAGRTICAEVGSLSPFAIFESSPMPSVSVGDAAVAEGDGGLKDLLFAVSLSNAYSLPVTVDLATADDTAMAGSDYSATAGTLTFDPGETAKSFAVPVQGDETDEPDERFFLDASGIVNGTPGDARGEGTVTDDDPLPAVSAGSVALGEGDSGSRVAAFAVTLSNPSSRTVTVSAATAAGTASAGSDFTPGSGVLAFAPGEVSRTFEVAVLGDALYEPDETFFLDLTDPAEATLGNPRGTATILDDDPLPSLSIADAERAEGDEGVADAVFTVSLSAASGGMVSVGFTTSDATAVAGVDYAAVSGEIQLAPGETAATVLVPVLGDRLDEADETFRVSLAGAVGAGLGASQAVATILDDDPLPAVSVVDTVAGEGDAEAIFTVTLSAASGRAVAVSYATGDETALAGEDYRAAAGALQFPAGVTARTIGVELVDDGTAEVGETFTLTLSIPVAAVLSRDRAIAAVNDDDSPPGADFHTLVPCRLFDTRQPDGPYGGPALAAGAERTFALAGRCGIPADAVAISLNLTVVAPEAPGHLSLYPGGGTPSDSTAINFRAGQTRANNGIYPLGGGGEGTLAVRAGIGSGTVDVILDVNGYFQ